MKTPAVQALLSSTTGSWCPQPFFSCLPARDHGEDTQRANISAKQKEEPKRKLPLFADFPYVP